MGGHCFKENSNQLSELNKSESFHSKRPILNQTNLTKICTENKNTLQNDTKNGLPVKKDLSRKKLLKFPKNEPRPKIIFPQKIQCEFSISSNDVTSEYKNLKKKAEKLFKNATIQDNKTTKKKSKKVKNIENSLKIAQNTDKNELETSSTIKKFSYSEINGKNIECESFSSKITEADYEETLNIEKMRKIQNKEYTGNYQKKNNKGIKYAKKVVPKTFLEQLNKEIKEEIENSETFYNKIYPICENIREYIENIVQNTLQENSIL